MPQKQGRLKQAELNYVLGKNRGYKPSCLDNSSIVVVRQTGWQEHKKFLQFILLKIHNITTNTSLGLNKFNSSAKNFILIDYG